MWKDAECTWADLTLIANDHLKKQRLLEETAQFFAKVIQTFPDVHSVRWRVKDVEHLLEKIIRKKSNKEKKYLSINVDNYSKIVTDLIGIRALHLFKEDYLCIDENIRASWKPEEVPIVYLRQGDLPPPKEIRTSRGFQVKNHPAGYRSVHYVVSSQGLKTKIYAELQVRTIFEEGWSEIDHRVRYPNHLDDEMVNYFLAIFNRMAGSADEMGSFVKELVSWIDESKENLALAEEEKNKALRALEQSIAKLEQTKGNVPNQASITQMKDNVQRLRTLQETFPAAFPESPSQELNKRIAKLIAHSPHLASIIKSHSESDHTNKTKSMASFTKLKTEALTPREIIEKLQQTNEFRPPKNDNDK